MCALLQPSVCEAARTWLCELAEEERVGLQCRFVAHVLKEVEQAHRWEGGRRGARGRQGGRAERDPTPTHPPTQQQL